MSHIDQLLAARLGLAVLQGLPAGESGRVVLITSATPGEGKSFVTRLLAHELSRTIGGDVALIGTSEGMTEAADTVSPDRLAGFAELISEGRLDDAALVSCETPHLFHVAPGRAVGLEPLFHSIGVTRALEALRQRFRLSLIDGPVLGSSGALPHEVDAILMVIDSRKTPPRAIRGALEDAAVDPLQITGVVLNHVPRSPSTWTARD